MDPRQPYAISKAAQEGVAVEAAVRWGFPVVVTRSFNHSGPGQRPVFVLPAMARRVVAVRRGKADAVVAGNVDVRRDIGDVRDVVRAYRLLVEGLATGRLGSAPLVVNVATGTSGPIRSLIEGLCALAGIPPVVRVDPTLMRANDPPEIRGDFSLLNGLTGWEPQMPVMTTLADLLTEAELEAASSV